MFLASSTGTIISGIVIIVVTFLFVAFMKAVIHNLIYGFGFKEFLKKYFRNYSIYCVLYLIISIPLLMNGDAAMNFVFLMVFSMGTINIIDAIIFYITDYRHLGELFKYLFFAIVSVIVSSAFAWTIAIIMTSLGLVVSTTL